LSQTLFVFTKERYKIAMVFQLLFAEQAQLFTSFVLHKNRVQLRNLFPRTSGNERVEKEAGRDALPT
jgi:hypothetical protein